MRKISSARSEALHGVAGTRRIEAAAARHLPPHALMQRAGLAIARLTLALAPHARHIWIACGPGNDGGDGFEAALQLQRLGKHVTLTWTGPAPGQGALPPDARASYQSAMNAGIALVDRPPPDADFCIDALLGLGGRLGAGHAPGAALAALAAMHAAGLPLLCVDVPTGLNGDSGQQTWTASSTDASRQATSAARRHTLSLLTLKPGLFTASGRDWAGEVWFDDLGIPPHGEQPDAWLLGADRAAPSPRQLAAQASHKGSFGDVAILGGEWTPRSHMSGAALLAASAALHAGAGRVMVALLGRAGPTVDTSQPELMFRSPDALDLAHQTLVCGCGGGKAVQAELPRVLSGAHRLVLDADALNAVAQDSALQALLVARQHRGDQTVLTPHPLEAARLAGITAADVQAQRLATAQGLADRFGCTVVLKGSGSVIAAPLQVPRINASGNAMLATAGTGDVLAGMVGAWLAGGVPAFEAACGAVFAHGLRADDWVAANRGMPLTASRLATGG